MNTTIRPPSRARLSRRAALGATALAALLAALPATTGCSDNLFHSYGSFKSALERGASCAELFDQRARFDDAETLAKIDRDLARIGCTSRSATRNDR